MTGLSYWLWSSEGPVKLRSQLHLWVTSILPLIADQSGRLCSADVCIWISPLTLNAQYSSLKLFAYSSPLFTKSDVHSVSPHALDIPPPVLSIFLPTCSASVSQWLSEEERHSFGNLPLAVIRWVREWINIRNINRIFTSFHQTGLTGYSYPITPRGCGSNLTEGLPLRWNSWEQEIGRLQSTCLVSDALPLSPQRPPLYYCAGSSLGVWKEHSLPPGNIHWEIKVKLMHWPRSKTISLFHISCGKK